MAAVPTACEREVLREVHAWRNRVPNWMGRQVKRLNAPLRHVSNLTFRLPGVEWTVDHLVAGLIRTTNEIAQDLVIRDSILSGYRTRGYAVYKVADIALLGMEAMNEAVRGIKVKYQSITAVQGVSLGIAGFAGIVPDIVGLVALNLRAVGEIATCCGYDIAEGSERSFALRILHEASEESLSAQDASTSVARRHTKQTVEQLALSGSIRGIAKALGLRLMQSKAAQIVPVAGMVAGGGFNAYYTARVCEAAQHLYRERRVHDRYGILEIQETSGP